MSPATKGVGDRLAAWCADAAVVFGSGLAVLPDGAEVEEELDYAALGWPEGDLAGHEHVLRLVRAPVGGASRRLALACGRPHVYEGWRREELEAPVRGLAAAGVRRLVLTNSCGSLGPGAPPAAVVVCGDVVDLQQAPAQERPPRLPVCDAGTCSQVASALVGDGPATVGTYVAVPGPQFETPAEAAWLGAYGDVVGMSAAPEVRVARARGVECVLLAAVANVAAAVDSHEAVLAAGGRLARRLASGLGAALVARWPELA